MDMKMLTEKWGQKIIYHEGHLSKDCGDYSTSGKKRTKKMNELRDLRKRIQEGYKSGKYLHLFQKKLGFLNYQYIAICSSVYMDLLIENKKYELNSLIKNSRAVK